MRIGIPTTYFLRLLDCTTMPKMETLAELARPTAEIFRAGHRQAEVLRVLRKVTEAALLDCRSLEGLCRCSEVQLDSFALCFDCHQRSMKGNRMIAAQI